MNSKLNPLNQIKPKNIRHQPTTQKIKLENQIPKPKKWNQKKKKKNQIQEIVNFSWNSRGKKGRENPSAAAAEGFVVDDDNDDYGGLLFIFFFVVVFNLLVFVEVKLFDGFRFEQAKH